MKPPSRRVWAPVGSAAAVVALASGIIGWSAGHADTHNAGDKAVAMPLKQAAVANLSHADSPAAAVGPQALSWTPSSDQLSAVAAALKALASGANGKLDSAVWTTTTRAQYLAVTGEGSLTDAQAASAPVIVALGTGSFTFTNISVPYGVSVPSGKYIECAFDPVAGHITDWGTDDAALDQLGPVQPLPLG